MDVNNKAIWVWMENAPEGGAKKISLEMLTAARHLAAQQGGPVVAVVLGAACDAGAKEAAAFGADQVIIVQGPEYAAYTTDAYVTALAALAEQYAPGVVLMGATLDGRDLAPRLAARLKTGCASDCTALDIDAATGRVVWTRPVFSSTQLETVTCPDSLPQIGTVRSAIFQKSERDDGRTAEVVTAQISVPAAQIRTQVLEFIANTGEKIDLEGAQVIVAGGRGIGSVEGFDQLRELAALLGGTVGASRAAVDAEWIPLAHQVGQTGKTVSPKLYFACGISGAIQHLAGMTGSDCIVAINKDPDAPIFKIADYGIVGNIKEVLPILIEEVRRLKA